MDVSSEIPILQMAIRLAAAAGLALLLGLERELRGKQAGLRTHMLVSLGAAAFMMMGLHVLVATATGDPSARIDPTRIIEGVIGGVGFLGAGSIIQSGGKIHGITTGASIWAAGAIGLACGIGNLLLAVMLTAFVVAVVVLVGFFEKEVIEEK